ncbi:nitroreductase family deazaflavin-dependent oxidoreductase [Microbacterium sp. NPDC057659]|uniref:nitroreductase family deazaflavin-dependent oxidoreductase n=1 Tax=Microbacterium sp. NPDC057659 TaxID=3346198 RepID=UPI0036707C1E
MARSFSHGLQKALEPAALAMSGRRWFPLYATVHHRGRKSGTAFTTPVAVVPSRSHETIVIGLPWGTTTNWARNVVAAGFADLDWKGGVVHTVDPRIVDAAEAAALCRRPFSAVVRRMPGAIVLRIG